MSLGFTHRTWLDENALAGAVIAASMEDHFATGIVELDRAHERMTFLRDRYEPIG
jgi:hypothetical protein